ncbi:MAG: hypothetical protein ACT4PI_10725 [Actinomycetota bacterium]
MTGEGGGARTHPALGALASLLGVLSLAGFRGSEPPDTYPDAPGDATVCDTTVPPPGGNVVLDLASARFDGVTTGGDYRFEVAGFGNLSDEVRDNGTRDPLVAVRIVPGPGRSPLDLRRGVERGAAISDVVDQSGVPVPDSRLTVDRGPAGEAIFTASGLDLAGESTWGVFTRYTAEDQLVCDKLDGAFVDDVPALPLESAGPPPASPTTPATTGPTERAADAPARGGSSSDGFPWWVLFLGGGVGLLILFFFWIWPRLPWWFPPFREDRGGHGAPTTPPPEQTDFGE